MKDLKDLRKLSTDELRAEIDVITRQLFKTQMAVRAQQEKQVHLVKALKKNIARMETIITEKELAELKASIQQTA